MLHNKARCFIGVKYTFPHTSAMARNDPQVNLRVPAELKRRLDDAARDNRRSLTAEVVARLEASFAGSESAYDPATSASGLVTRAIEHVCDQPQIVSREEARARLEQLQLNEQQRQAVAAVLVAAIEALGIAPQKKTSNGD